MSLQDTAAYAVHQIDLARRAIKATARNGSGTALTARETEVLRLIADGATTRQISEQLFISAKTADNHIQHIYTKLGVTGSHGPAVATLRPGPSDGPSTVRWSIAPRRPTAGEPPQRSEVEEPLRDGDPK